MYSEQQATQHQNFPPSNQQHHGTGLLLTEPLPDAKVWLPSQLALAVSVLFLACAAVAILRARSVRPMMAKRRGLKSCLVQIVPPLRAPGPGEVIVGYEPVTPEVGNQASALSYLQRKSRVAYRPFRLVATHAVKLFWNA